MKAKALLTAALMTAVFAGVANAGLQVTFSYLSEPADIRVWLDRGFEDGRPTDYDVYPSMSDVSLFVRASRSCYATVYVVDTEGFIHVVEPVSPFHNAFLRGGELYRFGLGDAGFCDWTTGRGVAYAFAVSSPVPFDYDGYDLALFGHGPGVQVYGDPFVASRMFYESLVPAGCDYRVVGVSYARFYVGHYVRYPNYLCVGWHDHDGVRTYCRGGCSAYRTYYVHVANPYRVLRPTQVLAESVTAGTRIVRSTTRYKSESQVVTARTGDSRYKSGFQGQTQGSNKMVVRSSKESFIKGRTDYSALRHELDSRGKSKSTGATLQKHPQSESKTASVGKKTKTTTAKAGKTGGGSKSAGKEDARNTKSTKKAQKKR